MKYLKIVCVAFLALFALRSKAIDDKLQLATDSLYNQLAKVRTTADSILVLSNLFDIQLSQDQSVADSLATRIYQLAIRHNDYPTALEMLRNRGNLNLRDLDTIENLLIQAQQIESANPNLMRETSTFLRMSRNSWYNIHASEQERRNRFESELQRWNVDPPSDLYDQIVLLHSVCLSLSQKATGELLKDYLRKLGSLVDKLPPAQHSIRNTYYIQAAINFYNSGDPAEGMKADRKTLAVIDSLEMHFKGVGRPFRRYDRYKFLIYGRFLSNYKNLTSEQADEYYELACRYRDLSPRAQRSKTLCDLLDLYYAMSKKDYQKAHGLLQQLLGASLTRIQKKKVYEMGIDCAEAVGDTAMLVTCLKEQNAMLSGLLDTGLSDKIRELQILYDVNGMKENMARLELANKQSENETQRTFIIFSLIVIALLLAGVVIVAMQYRKSKKLANSLADANAALSSESQRLLLTQGKLTRARDQARSANQLKSDFIRNLGHELSEPINAIIEYSNLIVDCADAYGKEYLSSYAELVTRNCNLLLAVTSDVFNMTDDKQEPILLQRELVSLEDVLDNAIETVRPTVPRDVSIGIKPGTEDITCMVDPRRLQQIILNLLRNAASYTEHGSISVTFGLSSNRQRVIISVTDTGPGVDPDIIERVFERGVIGKNVKSGQGLGLPISRLLARVMGGDLSLDSSFKKGARFVLTIPYVIREK